MSTDFSFLSFYPRLFWCGVHLLICAGLGDIFPYLVFNSRSVLNLFFKVLNQWIMDQVPLGNKAPRPGFARQFWCPACKGLLVHPLALSSGHVLLECVAVEGTGKGNFFNYFLSFACSGTRFREGIRLFLDECATAGRSEKSAHFLYVNGFDPKRCKIPVQDHLKRGASLARLTDVWLSTWGAEEESWVSAVNIVFFCEITRKPCVRYAVSLQHQHVIPFQIDSDLCLGASNPAMFFWNQVFTRLAVKILWHRKSEYCRVAPVCVNSSIHTWLWWRLFIGVTPPDRRSGRPSKEGGGPLNNL